MALFILISVLCVEITKPEPTMSFSRVLRVRIVQIKDANLKTNFKTYDLTLTCTVPLADKTSAR